METPSDYELTELYLESSDSRRVALGRWKPSDGRSAPLPVAAADGFVAIETVVIPSASYDRATVSKELHAYVTASRAVHKSSERHFVKLINAFVQRRSDTEYDLFVIQELRLGSMSDRLRDTARPPSERELVYIALATGRALRFLHGNSKIHGAVHPQNVFFGVDGTVLLGFEMHVKVRAP